MLTRRQMVGGALLSGAAGACRRRRATGFPGYALVAAAGEDSLAIVDLNTFHLARRVELKTAPSFVTADSSRAYVVTPDTGTVHVIDPEEPEIRTAVHLADHIDFLRLTPEPGQALAASRKQRELILSDLAARQVQKRWKLTTEPFDIDLKPHATSKQLYAAISGGSAGTVERIDVHSGERKVRTLGKELGSIRFRNDGKLLFVAGYSDNTLIVLDSQNLGTLCELPLPMRPENFAFTADQGQLFVSGTGMDGVSIVFVYDRLEVEQTVLAGHAPGAMVCSSEPRYLFVASRASSEITVLSVDTRKLIALTQAGQRPIQIAITPDQQYALVLNQASGDLAAIRITTIRRFNRYTSGASLFAMMPVGLNPTSLALYSRRL